MHMPWIGHSNRTDYWLSECTAACRELPIVVTDWALCTPHSGQKAGNHHQLNFCWYHIHARRLGPKQSQKPLHIVMYDSFWHDDASNSCKKTIHKYKENTIALIESLPFRSWNQCSNLVILIIVRRPIKSVSTIVHTTAPWWTAKCQQWVGCA